MLLEFAKPYGEFSKGQKVDFSVYLTDRIEFFMKHGIAHEVKEPQIKTAAVDSTKTRKAVKR